MCLCVAAWAHASMLRLLAHSGRGHRSLLGLVALEEMAEEVMVKVVKEVDHTVEAEVAVMAVAVEGTAASVAGAKEVVGVGEGLVEEAVALVHLLMAHWCPAGRQE